MRGWNKHIFSSFIEINPKVTLKKGEEYSFVEMKNLDPSNKYVSPSQTRELKGGARFKNHDTLFARITPCLENGKICQVKNLINNKGYGSTEFLVFRGLDGVSDSDFVYYLSRNPFFRRFSESKMIGTSGRQRVAKDAYDNLELTLPPLPEQKAIASILSALDDKIELNLQMNKTLEEMAMALYKHWFVDFGPFQDQNFVDSELGMIPEGWEVKSIYELANYVNGAAFKSNDFSMDGKYVIKIAELKNGISANTKKSNKIIKNELIIDSGSVLFSWSASLDVFLWDKGSALLNQHIFNVIPNGNLPLDILYFMLKDIIGYFQAIAADRATTMGHIKLSHLKETKRAFPISNLQSKLEMPFKNLFDQILINKIQSQTLTKLRDTLLPKLISGEVRLKEFQKTVEQVL